MKRITREDVRSIEAAAKLLAELTGEPVAVIQARMIKMALDGRGPR